MIYESMMIIGQILGMVLTNRHVTCGPSCCHFGVQSPRPRSRDPKGPGLLAGS